MNFDEFAAQFGAKGEFVRSIGAEERTAFKRAATRLHKEGFDWYIADDDLCFGVKPTDSLRASPRGGRLWKSCKMTINLSSKQFKAMTPALLARLKSSGGIEEMRGSRLRFSIAQFDELVSDANFLKEFADLCGVSEPRGLWPDQRRELAKDQSEVTSIQQVFGRTHERLAVVQRLAWNRKNRKALEEGFTWHWPRLSTEPDLVVLHFEGEERREVWVGRYRGTKPARDGDKRFELHVDEFRLVGVHHPHDVDETDLYGGEAGGGSRIYVWNTRFEEKDDDRVPRDTVKKVLAQVRQNQGRFKTLLKKVWGAKCAVTGCREESVLEGAHIIPYAVGRDYAKSNGLLLRADIHALFDARLLSVDADGRVHVAKSVKDTGYSSLQGKRLTLPKAKWPAKLADTLAERHADYIEAHS
jgi:hypothetical protein